MASNTYIGLPIGNNYTVISGDRVLNKVNGSVLPINNVLKDRVTLTSSIIDASVTKQVEIVTGVDGKRIDFTLANSEGEIESSEGYLIEIYVSGSNGVLTRVYKEDVVDVVNDDTLSEGFSNYLVLKLDVE